MTYEFEYLMHLVGVSALGLPFEMPKKELSWRKLFELASEQAVFALATSAVKPVWNTLDAALRQEVRTHLYSVIVSEEIRLKAMWDLIGCLRNADIPFAVLKGIGLSALYKTPELRESGDVDIYVGKDDEKRALALLQRYGVSIKKRNPAQHESAGYHPEIGPIELHAYLFREEDRKLWFGRSEKYSDTIDPFWCQRIDDEHEIPVLSVQNNVEFLCLHCIKHFIREGISIRNILDIGLFLQTYEKEVNHNRLWELLTSLQYDGVIQAVLNVCVHYFHMDKSRFVGYSEMNADIIQLLLDDIEMGGYLGIKEKNERSKSSQEYEQIVLSDRNVTNGDNKWKKRRIRWERIYAAMYNKKKLQSKYSYARNHEWLLPIAWVSHLISGTWKVFRAFICRTDAQSRASTDKRMFLFRKLGIM